MAVSTWQAPSELDPAAGYCWHSTHAPASWSGKSTRSFALATSKLGTGGSWETPLVGRDGSVTFGIGNPYQTAATAIAHPSAQLYADSDVNLDAATGKLRWYYQAVSNDFMDHDMQTSPIAATIGAERAVLGSGNKMSDPLGVRDGRGAGEIAALNLTTGKVEWDTKVPAMPLGAITVSNDLVFTTLYTGVLVAYTVQ